ncbi:MAG: 16S rRNA (cytosine1402-N4)-methyltransferase [Candidatus Paceibacteria bacterium]|jgi:16S rRNA (cytosine1402-N4)-methyltransferase
MSGMGARANPGETRNEMSEQSGGGQGEASLGAGAHIAVLPEETIGALLAGRDEHNFEGWFVDGTTGAGGHSEMLLERCPKLQLLCIDQDPDALKLASKRLARFGERVRLRRARHSELCRVIRKERVGRLSGALFDLGVCSLHLDRAERGFSFAEDGPLDMRMDPSRARSAADIVNGWDEGDLADLIYYEGDETHSRKIAHAIVDARRRTPFMRTGALAHLVAQTLGGGGGKIHPATRTFQALRRAVNEEGEELMGALQTAEHWLDDGGVLAVISFHSGEDRVVKRFLQQGAREGRWALQSKKPIVAAHTEVRSNRRSRSAKLRAAARVRAQRGEVV